MANAVRALAMDAVQAANSGHPGMPMGMANVAAVLFNRFIKLDPAAPKWPDRDRFVLSAGHGSMLLYAVHHLLGYGDMPMDQLRSFRQLGGRTAGRVRGSGCLRSCRADPRHRRPIRRSFWPMRPRWRPARPAKWPWVLSPPPALCGERVGGSDRVKPDQNQGAAPGQKGRF